MQKRRNLFLFIIIPALIISSGTSLFSKKMQFEMLNLDKISKYDGDRIAYQRIEKYTDMLMDDSYDALLVMKDKKSYLIYDGYDLMIKVLQKKFQLDVDQKSIEDGQLWENKINGKPDYIRIKNRRQDVLTNSNEEFVATNFGVFYKTVRDKFIEQHAAKFRLLMKNRGESGLRVTYQAIDTKISDSEETFKNKKYSSTAIAKSHDDTIYYCEDLDGDGITETFTVTRADGFNWGFNSGPNIIFIFKNKDKEIESMIGKLANEAVFGSVDEEKNTMKNFPKQKDILDMIDSITPMDNFYQ